MWGARTVLTVAPLAVLGATLLGSLLGLTAGYFGGWIDLAVTRVCDIVLSFPVIILYMIVLATFGASAVNIIAGARPHDGADHRPHRARAHARAARARVRGGGQDAGRVARSTSWWSRSCPNARGPLIVDMCLRMGYTIVLIGVLGFLGIGLPPPDPDWGGMVKETYGMISVWPHMALVPCVADLLAGRRLQPARHRPAGAGPA